MLTCPESVAEALAVYREGQLATKHSPEEPRHLLRDMDSALAELKAEEQSAIHAQLAGIRAGASPDAYAPVFADIALRRKDLEARRAALSGSHRRTKAGKKGDEAAMAGMLKAALDVLSDPNVPGSEKRSALAPIVERVICRKGGGDVVFVPGLFDEPRDNGGSLMGGDDHQTYQTTCIGINTQR